MIMNAVVARNNLFRVIGDVMLGEPAYITSRKGNVVLVAEEDFRAMEETFYLASIPGMRDKIIEGLNTPLSQCVKDE